MSIPIETRRHMAAMDEQQRQTRALQDTQNLTAEMKAQSERQAETLEALRQLGQAQATEAKANAKREERQQTFNRRMSWAAVLLAGAAVVVPFVVLFLDKTLS